MKLFSLGLILFLVSAATLIGCQPSPEQYAAASATVMKAENLRNQEQEAGQASVAGTQTAVAVFASAIQTRTANESMGTQTAVAVSARTTAMIADINVSATQTVMPSGVGAGIARNNADGWNATLVPLGLATLIVIVAGLAFAVSQVIHREAVTIRRDKNGQLPVLYDRGVMINPARTVGPAVVLPPSDVLSLLGRIHQWIKTGQLPELPASPVGLTDNGAIADQLLLSAQADAQATGIASMFQPDASTKERDDKIKTAQRARLPVGVLQGDQVTPPPRVLVIAEDQLNALAQGNESGTILIEPPLPDASRPQVWSEVENASNQET